MTTAITFTHSNFHLIFAAGTHCTWLKHVKSIYVRVLSARSHLATVQMQVIEVVSAAQCYSAHGHTAISKCSTTEATTAITPSKYVEAIRNVTPHSCVIFPRAGNGAPGAECFPLIGLKVTWLCRFQGLCAKLHEEKSQAKTTYLMT